MWRCLWVCVRVCVCVCVCVWESIFEHVCVCGCVIVKREQWAWETKHKAFSVSHFLYCLIASLMKFGFQSNGTQMGRHTVLPLGSVGWGLSVWGETSNCVVGALNAHQIQNRKCHLWPIYIFIFLLSTIIQLETLLRGRFWFGSPVVCWTSVIIDFCSLIFFLSFSLSDFSRVLRSSLHL